MGRPGLKVQFKAALVVYLGWMDGESRKVKATGQAGRGQGQRHEPRGEGRAASGDWTATGKEKGRGGGQAVLSHFHSSGLCRLDWTRPGNGNGTGPL